LFTPTTIEVLRLACEEAAWLLGRGYTSNSVIDVVGRRHQLHARQRLALQRSICSEGARQARARKQVDAIRVRDKTLQIDGFNLIIGLEVALSGGPLLRGADGALRDLAGLRGSYHMVEETDAALILVGEILDDLSAKAARFYLDSPVSNSGRLSSRIVERACRWKQPVEVELVANPDRLLKHQFFVVSSDSVVLDESGSWFNFLDYAINSKIDSAWIVELGTR
jgi:hypothetical protein